MRVWACLVFIVAFACSGASIARAGAWVWPENHGQALLTTTFADAQKVEADLFGLVGATEDVRAGLGAFLDRTTAVWQGR